MSSFLRQVAAKMLTEHGRNLAGVLVLTPNHRLSTYFINTLHQLAEGAVIAPQVSTLQDWMMQRSKLVLRDNLDLVTGLYNAYRKTGGDQPLDDFIGTANVMLADFEELDLQMANARSFFKNLELLQSMKTFEPGTEPSAYALQYRRFWEQFGLVYAEFKKQLAEEGAGYRGMILREVAENIAQVDLKEYKAAYLPGFSSLNRVDETAINYLVREMKAHVITDGDAYYIKDEQQEAGLIFRKHKHLYKAATGEWPNDMLIKERRIEVVGAAKNIGQVKVLADILQNRIKQNDDLDFTDTVVVVPDERVLSPIIAHLPAKVSTVNITMGLSLTGSHTASWLEILFRLYDNSRRSSRDPSILRFYYRNVFDLLGHPFFQLLSEQKSTSVFVDTMRRQNRIQIVRTDILAEIGNELGYLLFDGETVTEFAAYLKHAMQQLIGKLVHEVRSGKEIWAPELEIAYRVFNKLEASAQAFASGTTISIKTLIGLLRENFRNERVPLEGDPVQGLQIMGLLETRGLDFKNVIVLSANEGILPAGKSQNTFIPYEMRREFLTTYKDRDASTAYLFYRLLQRAENVFLLYNTEPDELGGGEKSRYILQLEKELTPAKSKTVIADYLFAVDPPAVTTLQDVGIQKSQEVLGKIYNILTGSGISPSALNTYINCPMQYYFRYVAGLRETDDMEESMEASTIGSAVHYALEKTYELAGDAGVTAEFIDAQLKQRNRLEELVKEELSKRFDVDALSRGRNLLLYKVCVKLVEEFLKYESSKLKTDASMHLQMIMLEKELRAPLTVHGREVFVSGRVDRIEKFNGVVQIADYKTGTSKRIPLLNEDAWELLTAGPDFAKPVQLLVYAWLYYRTFGEESLPLRSGIYWLRDSDKKLDTLALDKSNDLLGRGEILRFEEKLRAVLEELTDPHAPFAKVEDEKRCRYCEFAKICGRD